MTRSDSSAHRAGKPEPESKDTRADMARRAPAQTNSASVSADSDGLAPGLAASAVESRERLIVLSILVVSSAVAAMLFVQFAVPLLTASALGAVACAFFMLLHDQSRKSAEIARLASELARQSAMRPAPTEPVQATRVGATDAVAAAVERAVATRRSERKSVDELATPQPQSSWGAQSFDTTASARWEPVSDTVAEPRSRAAPAPSSLDIAADMKPKSGDNVSARAAPSSVMRDQWALRPRESKQWVGSDAAPAAAGQIEAGPIEPVLPSAPISTIETDLALVQRKIKALADEVNGGDVARAPIPAANTIGAPPFAAPLPSVMDTSIGALKSVAASMRSAPLAAPAASSGPSNMSPFGDLVIPATAQKIAGSPPAASQMSMPAQAPFTAASEMPFPDLSQAAMATSDLPPPAVSAADTDLDFAMSLPASLALPLEPPVVSPKVAAMTRAIEHGRMDVLLSPIVGLMTHEVTHYDVKVRLKADEGGYYENPEQDLVLAGAEVLALFDTARVTRAASLARRLEARGKSGALMSDISGPSLTHGGFLDTFARIYEDRERIAGQLVLTFSQADMERFTPPAWQALSDMHAFGFRFALDRLEHVNTDFASLAQRGFAFVKLDASVLLNGMASSRRFVPGDDVCRQIAGAGLTVIADAIADEAMRARVFGFGVLFGQGQLFGGARLVSVDPTPAGAQSTAAA